MNAIGKIPRRAGADQRPRRLARPLGGGDYHGQMSSPEGVWQRPRALTRGDRIALVAPGGPVTPERIDKAVTQCHALGFESWVGPGAYERQGYMAGPDERRLADLQHAFDDDSIAAVWALRGGYGATRIVHRMRAPAANRAKAFVGFSDNTAIHVALYQQGIVTFHGPHAGGAFPVESEASLRATLLQTSAAGALPTRASDPTPCTLHGGSVEAPLFGGNLAILAALCGTRLPPSARGAILFLEDVGEPAYRVDRMLTQLKSAGGLDDVRGLALGRFTDCGDEEGVGVPAVLRELADSLGVPAVLDLPIGHVEHNCTIPLGCRARLDADAATLTLIEPAVSE